MITTAQMRLLEDLAGTFGVSKLQLMEHAGKQVSEILKRRSSLSHCRIIILCGGGNNGGDGFVAARYLAAHHPTVLLLGIIERLPHEARENFARLQNDARITVIPAASPHEVSQFFDSIEMEGGQQRVLIDAMLGTGLHGEVREPYRTAIERFNKSRGYKVAIDIPSGLDPDTGEAHTAALVDLTITLQDKKPGLDKQNSQIVVADIGIPRQAVQVLQHRTTEL